MATSKQAEATAISLSRSCFAATDWSLAARYGSARATGLWLAGRRDADETRRIIKFPSESRSPEEERGRIALVARIGPAIRSPDTARATRTRRMNPDQRRRSEFLETLFKLADARFANVCPARRGLTMQGPPGRAGSHPVSREDGSATGPFSPRRLDGRPPGEIHHVGSAGAWGSAEAPHGSAACLFEAGGAWTWNPRAQRPAAVARSRPLTLTSINNMGSLLQVPGKRAEAEAYYREALEKSRRVLGDEHPDTLTSINNMGFLLREQGKFQEAIDLLSPAQPDKGYDAKAAEWRAKLEAWQASTQPAATQPASTEPAATRPAETPPPR
jgi:tetratricopeptide (TPR) repeat protein